MGASYEFCQSVLWAMLVLGQAEGELVNGEAQMGVLVKVLLQLCLTPEPLPFGGKDVDIIPAALQPLHHLPLPSRRRVCVCIHDQARLGIFCTGGSHSYFV